VLLPLPLLFALGDEAPEEEAELAFEGNEVEVEEHGVVGLLLLLLPLLFPILFGVEGLAAAIAVIVEGDEDKGRLTGDDEEEEADTSNGGC